MAIIQSVNVQRNNDRVALVQYSSEPSVNFYLNSYQTYETVAEALQNVQHKGGRERNTGKAIHFVKDNVFTVSSGSRHHMAVPQVLVLITGGRSSDDFRNAVANLKAMGVIVFVLGTEKADVLEIQSISYKPEYAMMATDPRELSGIDSVHYLTSQFAFNLIYIFAVIVTLCTLTASFKHILSSQIDVLFLLDGSDDSRKMFEDIKDFVKYILPEFNIGPNKDQVAVVQFSNTTQTEFDFNKYSTLDDIERAVAALKHKRGYPHYIGQALQYVKDNIFTTESGSRIDEGIPQLLILIYGGRSQDDIRTPVKMLKETGVISIAIGTSDADTIELQTIAHEPKYALSIDDYEEIAGVRQQLLFLMNAHSVQPVAPKKDIGKTSD
uniref:VWFA domain-containing protein n=1 Tax=Periophthalmus magnuspinnatus TaxID=409849 RepID=A0A3B4B755_9GOBI